MNSKTLCMHSLFLFLFLSLNNIHSFIHFNVIENDTKCTDSRLLNISNVIDCCEVEERETETAAAVVAAVNVHFPFESSFIDFIANILLKIEP